MNPRTMYSPKARYPCDGRPSRKPSRTRRFPEADQDPDPDSILGPHPHQPESVPSVGKLAQSSSARNSDGECDQSKRGGRVHIASARYRYLWKHAFFILGREQYSDSRSSLALAFRETPRSAITKKKGPL